MPRKREPQAILGRRRQPARMNLTGRRFGRLTPIMHAPSRGRKVYWTCECDCTAFVDVAAGDLRSGHTQSCGCLHREMMATTRRTHGAKVGGTTTPEYGAWNMMRNRCTNPNYVGYKNYGGRGIAVCDRWRGSFAAFLADVGERPSPDLSLDRIDNDGNYEPGNVRWATAVQQANNKRPRCR